MGKSVNLIQGGHVKIFGELIWNYPIIERLGICYDTGLWQGAAGTSKTEW